MELAYLETTKNVYKVLALNGSRVYTGKTTVYYGSEEIFDDNKGHVLFPNQPMAVMR